MAQQRNESGALTPPGGAAERERHVRGKALVAKVLTAAIAELARLGYEKLSMEDVAAAAGVNKTTLYRRWTNKRDLVQEALKQLSDDIPTTPDHGSLRLDMLSQVRLQRDLLQQPVIRGLVRMACGGPAHPDIEEYGESIREAKDAQALLIYMRAIARGELPADTDVRVLHGIVSGAVTELVLFRRVECDEAKLTAIVDMILEGALRKK